MASYKTQGIVLSSINFGEADKILTILTERLGKIKVMAKGIRKIKSHLAGSLEPFMLLDLQLHEGRTFFTVTGAVIRSDFPNIHNDLGKSARAFFVGELIDRFAAENQSAVEIFDLFSIILESLDKNCRDLIIYAFELKIIEAAGFKPELYNCVHCKEKIRPGANFWDNVEGGVICQTCQSKFRHGKEISDETIKLFRFIEASSFEKINRLKVGKKIEAEAEEVLSGYIKGILERELKSEKFMKMV